jgi:hypothetical protein
MSKKDYIKFAEMFKEQLGLAQEENDGSISENAIEGIVFCVADIFAEDNPNFNRSKFLKACGLEDEQ